MCYLKGCGCSTVPAAPASSHHGAFGQSRDCARAAGWRPSPRPSPSGQRSPSRLSSCRSLALFKRLLSLSLSAAPCAGQRSHALPCSAAATAQHPWSCGPASSGLAPPLPHADPAARPPSAAARADCCRCYAASELPRVISHARQSFLQAARAPTDPRILIVCPWKLQQSRVSDGSSRASEMLVSFQRDAAAAAQAAAVKKTRRARP